MRHPTPNRWAAALSLTAVLAAMLALCGCPFSQKKDDKPDPVTPPSRTSPDELLTNWFEKCYSQRDSIQYEEMLDDEFQFEFLEADADAVRDLIGQNNFWGKTLDLNSTGGLFGAEQVQGITLNINVGSKQPYAGIGCEGCEEVETTVSLRVNTIRPGEEELTLVVDSPQLFIVKPDPDPQFAGQWVIWRQYDKPRS